MTITEYIKTFNDPVKSRLIHIYQVIQDNLPDAEEKFSYGMPTFWQKKNLIHFAGYANHIGIYPGPKTIVHFAQKLTQIPHSKGAIQFLHNQELPLELLHEILNFIKESR